MRADPGQVAAALKLAAELDDSFRHAGRDNPSCTPWMPFQRCDFAMMLMEAIPEAESHDFLDIGCGPGSKMLIAERIFGLPAHGFDRVPELVAAARSHGLSADCGDALDFTRYGDFGLIWFNRVFRDRDYERILEARVWERMRPGAVAITAHLENPPPGWFTVYEDADARRGVWKKPGGQR